MYTRILILSSLLFGAAYSQAATFGSTGLAPNIQYVVSFSSIPGNGTTNYIATPLTVNLTATQASAKIDIDVTTDLITSTGAVTKRGYVTVYKDGVDLDTSGTFEGLSNCISGPAASSNIPCYLHFTYIDTINDSNAHTYLVYFRGDTGNLNPTWNKLFAPVSLIVQELH